MFVDWDLLWCPIFAVDHYDGHCVGVFFGHHSSLVDGLQGCVVIGGVCKAYARPLGVFSMSHRASVITG